MTTEAQSTPAVPYSALIAEAQRYYSDPAYRLSLPCSECGRAGAAGCVHFPRGKS